MWKITIVLTAAKWKIIDSNSTVTTDFAVYITQSTKPFSISLKTSRLVSLIELESRLERTYTLQRPNKKATKSSSYSPSTSSLRETKLLNLFKSFKRKNTTWFWLVCDYSTNNLIWNRLFSKVQAYDDDQFFFHGGVGWWIEANHLRESRFKDSTTPCYSEP